MYENLEEMKVAPDRRGIPFDTQTFVEQSMYVAREIESGFNKFMMETGIEELNSFIESGDTVVYEGAKFDKFKESAVAFFQGILAKIKAAYESAVDKFNDIINKTYNKHAAKFKTLSKSDIDKYLTDDICKNKVGSIYIFNYDKFEKARTSVTQYRTMIEGGFSSNEKEEVDNRFKELESKMISYITGESSSSMAAAVKALKADAERKLEPTKRNAMAYYDTLIDMIKGNTFKKGTKLLFKSEKDNIDKSISKIKKQKDGDKMEIFSAQIKLLKTLSSANHIICSGYLDCITRETRHAYASLLKIYSTVSRKKNGANKSESTNEAYSYSNNEINQADYITSLGSNF